MHDLTFGLRARYRGGVVGTSKVASAGGARGHLDWTVALAAVLGLAGLWLHAWRYRDFLTDDAYISLRYAERWVQGKGLTWTDGEAVEGYSNLSFVLGTGVLHALGIELVTAARILCGLGTSAAVTAVAWRFRRGRTGLPWLSTWAALATAASGTLAAWSFGGLEQGLMAGLLAWAWVLTLEWLEGRAIAPWALGLLYGLLCISRPDAPLLCATALASVVMLRGWHRGWRLALAVAWLPALFVLGQLTFRISYYDAWLPNTAHAKLALTTQRLHDGWSYLWQSLAYVGPLLVASVATLWPRPRSSSRRNTAVLCGTSLGLWCLYLLVIGGDFFCGRRQMFVLAIAMALLSAELWATMAASRRQSLVAGLALVSLAATAVSQWFDPENLRALTYRWPQRGAPVGRFLRTAFADKQPLLAVEAAGSLPYYTGFAALDMLGLNDRYLAYHRPADFGQGILGHELGDPDYVLSRRPDLILFCNAIGQKKACHVQSRALQERPEFRQDYRFVSFKTADTPPVYPQVWIRWRSKIGISLTDDSVVVPAYFAAQHDSVAELDEHGDLFVRASADAPLALYSIPLSGGQRWRIEGRASGPVAYRLVTAPRARPIDLNDGETFSCDAGELARVTIIPAEPNTRVYELRFTRL